MISMITIFSNWANCLDSLWVESGNHLQASQAAKAELEGTTEASEPKKMQEINEWKFVGPCEQ